MNGLTPEQIAELKNKLIETRQSLEGQLQSFADKNDEIDNDYETRFEQIGDSPEENADEVTAYEGNLAIEHDLENHLREIDEALERIEKGTYGICSDCHTNMSIERLQAMPEATLCIKCEE